MVPPFFFVITQNMYDEKEGKNMECKTATVTAVIILTKADLCGDRGTYVDAVISRSRAVLVG